MGIFKTLPDAELVKAYENDMSISGMEKKYQANRATIYRHLRRCGIKIGRKQSTKWTTEEDRIMITESNAGQEIWQIGLKLTKRSHVAIRARVRVFKAAGKINKQPWD